ncbi:MAG: hypothetical protein DLM67_15625 [Candidatus Nephthysia bennettiae]|uniref:DUF4124 domain-containing protein n=1 Tax=Candidatus Nephthysia bennettiae TaxID=3127016 RepID=A0A934K6B7_9BACT|nr:hypothetical protein [Candidatus Dormibacteraeota bacterium]MBJ7612061.1 hypothetical protein [Candidatus Dormibacteraeota bacterium]PZR91960.1 MAG: hypothetical protein DLM67_15625 [Candidatus Dormibacteraeota bacterium]
MKRSPAAKSGARGRVRLLMAGVASATLVLTAAPAALAFAATGSPNPTSWRWDEVTGRLTACTSRGGLGSLVNCRPAEAVDLPAFSPEEHRKGRRVIVYVPVPTDVVQPTPGTSNPRSATRTGRVVSSPSPRAARAVRPARPVQVVSPTPSPSSSPSPRSDDEGGGHD